MKFQTSFKFLLLVIISVFSIDLTNASRKYTIEELMTMKFPHKMSNDIDADPCKSRDEKQGDIAVTNDYFEKELKLDRLSRSISDHITPEKIAAQENLYYKELNKYKNEYNDGLQIEEEGLEQYQKLKQLNTIKMKKEKLEKELKEIGTAMNETNHNKTQMSILNNEEQLKSIKNLYFSILKPHRILENLGQLVKGDDKISDTDKTKDQTADHINDINKKKHDATANTMVTKNYKEYENIFNEDKMMSSLEKTTIDNVKPTKSLDITISDEFMSHIRHGRKHKHLFNDPEYSRYPDSANEKYTENNYPNKEIGENMKETNSVNETELDDVKNKMTQYNDDAFSNKVNTNELFMKSNKTNNVHNMLLEQLNNSIPQQNESNGGLLIDKLPLLPIEIFKNIDMSMRTIDGLLSKINIPTNDQTDEKPLERDITLGKNNNSSSSGSKRRKNKVLKINNMTSDDNSLFYEDVNPSSNITSRHHYHHHSYYPDRNLTFLEPNSSIAIYKHNLPNTSFYHHSQHHRNARAATARKERIWDHGVIPYEIDSNFGGQHKALFKQAMKHWENFTCVKFIERNSIEHPNYILFTEKPCGCCSFVGKRGNGQQAISIGKNCDKFGIVVHELGHVVGFWHEHTRPDRDNHVQIIRENIMNGQDYNFNKLTEDEVNSLGLQYDYDSIMHYARNTFSKGTYLDTIQPIDYQKRGTNKRPEIGQRIKLSEGDIAQTNLLYKCARCGRTFQESSGTFSSPAYPNSINEHGDRCEWRITATHGERIVLNITDLDIFKSENCKSDYLEIKDGYWHKSKLIGRYCGKGKLDDPIISAGSRMLITYVASPNQIGHRGFSVNYEAVCGGEWFLQDVPTGHLESPNYPEDYQSSKECIWTLTAPADFQVALKFQTFEIENHDQCTYDYVQIWDGHSYDSPLIGTYCGYKLPPDIKSTGTKLMIKFVSDGSVQKPGFSAIFMKEYDECSLDNHGCEHTCKNTLGGYECLCKIGYELHSEGKTCVDACGGILDNPNGTVTSPSFPDLYIKNKTCIWEIVSPPQYRITLNFTHFDIEGNNLFQSSCEYDNVTIFSKIGDTFKSQGVFCGNRLPSIILSESNALRIEFHSDNSVQKSGFSAVYFTDKDECMINNGGCQHECRNTIGSYICTCHNGYTLMENGHDCKEGGCKYEITAPTGLIKTPNYPDYYPSKKECIWHFTTTPGHRIKLLFQEFELEPHQICSYDHVVMYDGDSPDSLTLGRFCGIKLPHPIITGSNQLYMMFKSDASVQRRGFIASHNTVCGGRLKATDTIKHLYSHARYGDDNYGKSMDCDWSIEADPGKNVHLTFLTFDIEDNKDCEYDYVEVYSGLDSSISQASYGRFCGNTNPTDIISINEGLLVRFRSDDTVVGKGFSASYVAIDNQGSKEFSEIDDNDDEEGEGERHDMDERR